jgi:hypothetical protein
VAVVGLFVLAYHPAVLFSQNKSVPAISQTNTFLSEQIEQIGTGHQPNEQAV